jgi:hypothetical protein
MRLDGQIDRVSPFNSHVQATAFQVELNYHEILAILSETMDKNRTSKGKVIKVSNSARKNKRKEKFKEAKTFNKQTI